MNLIYRRFALVDVSRSVTSIYATYLQPYIVYAIQ